MDAAIEPRTERIVRVWLWSASVVFLGAPILLPVLGARPSRAMFLLPMVNCVAVWIFVFFGARRTLAAGMRLRLDALAGRSPEDLSTEIRGLRAAIWSLLPLLLWPWLLIPLTWVLLVLTRSAV